MAWKMHEPVGNSIYAPLFLRLGIGSYFILNGLYILNDIPGFILLVESFKMVPSPVASLYAILVPYMAIAGGSLLVLGIWTTLGASLISILLLSFIGLLGLFPNSREIFNKDVILLAATLSLMYSGGGAWSIDRFRKTG